LGGIATPVGTRRKAETSPLAAQLDAFDLDAQNARRNDIIPIRTRARSSKKFIWSEPVYINPR
jgi:hypothetical protein